MSRLEQSPAASVEAISWYCALLLAMLLLLSCCESNEEEEEEAMQLLLYPQMMVMRSEKYKKQQPPCDEIYVVGEGETLHTISEKCRDPYIVEQNPHIHDSDDVFPGMLIKITPFNFKQ